MATIKIDRAHAELISLLYHNNKNALEAAEALLADPGFYPKIKDDVIRPIISKLRWIKSGLDMKVPRENLALHDLQLKHADTLRLNEINRLYTRLLPEQQEALELIMQGMIAGEIISVDTIPQTDDEHF